MMDNGQLSEKKEQASSGISLRSFLTVVLTLSLILALCSGLSYVIPQGSFQRDDQGVILTGTYEKGQVSGIALWRVVTAPVRVFASEDAVTIIMISVFLLIMSGIFNILEKTGGVQLLIARMLRRLKDKGDLVVALMVLVFMLFGSFFGMFEELVTLLPIVLVFLLSMGMDTMIGLGACLMAACFGFSTAITNPFSVGLAAQYAGVSPSDGVWLRLVLFGVIYLTVCGFLQRYLKKIKQDPKVSLTYEADLKKRAALQIPEEISGKEAERGFRIYAGFFSLQAVVLIAIASIRSISGLAIPILAASFLIFGLLAGFLVERKPGRVLGWFFRGAGSMLPAVVLIAIASSVKLVMTESGILDTVMHFALRILEGKSRFLAILLIYGLILFLQLFIGSASAKIVLVMPIVMPIARALGISPRLVILTYCMADGFTDVIIPTNPVLLIGLSMAGVSYPKWVKWTWKLQLIILAQTILILLLGIAIGY